MVQEIFIIEDKVDIAGFLRPRFKHESDFLLTSMNYR